VKGNEAISSSQNTLVIHCLLERFTTVSTERELAVFRWGPGLVSTAQTLYNFHARTVIPGRRVSVPHPHPLFIILSASLFFVSGGLPVIAGTQTDLLLVDCYRVPGPWRHTQRRLIWDPYDNHVIIDIPHWPLLSQINSVHIFTANFTNVYFNITPHLRQCIASGFLLWG
jgi:hypothetical protein